MMVLIAGAAVVLVLVYVWSVYNGLIRKRNEIDNSFSQIDVQLKRRVDLIPNLVESVKGYMKHEKGVLTELTHARSAMMKATTVKDKADASNHLSGTLKTLFAVSENYPKLAANENFLQLQEELAGTENKIAYARQHYNDVVMDFNTSIEVFPNVLFARQMGFKKSELFQTAESERKPVKVEF